MAKIGQNGPYGLKIGKIIFSQNNRKSDPRAPPQKTCTKLLDLNFGKKIFLVSQWPNRFPFTPVSSRNRVSRVVSLMPNYAELSFLGFEIKFWL